MLKKEPDFIAPCTQECASSESRRLVRLLKDERAKNEILINALREYQGQVGISELMDIKEKHRKILNIKD